MPTKRRRRPQGRREAFAPQHRHQLLTGHDYFDDAYGLNLPPEYRFDEAAARADWEDYREELMAWWLQDPTAWRRENGRPVGFYNLEPGGPGSRPWAWWAFEGPDDARLVFGLAPIDEPTARASGVRYCRGVLVESEAAFLRRRSLLLPGEADRIPAEAFEPVATYWPEEARRLEAERGRSA